MNKANVVVLTIIIVCLFAALYALKDPIYINDAMIRKEFPLPEKPWPGQSGEPIYSGRLLDRAGKDLLMENYKRKLKEVAGRRYPESPHVHEWVGSKFFLVEDIHGPRWEPRGRRTLEICKADGMLRVPKVTR